MKVYSINNLYTMTVHTPQGSVVIIGAGTQGRRLAYMVSIINEDLYRDTNGRSGPVAGDQYS